MRILLPVDRAFDRNATRIVVDIDGGKGVESQLLMFVEWTIVVFRRLAVVGSSLIMARQL